MRYQVANGAGYEELSEIVEGFLQEGWKLRGEIAVACIQDGDEIDWSYSQVMVRD